MSNIIEKVLKIAEKEINYTEKNNAKNLNSKTSGAGDGNYTKYWQALAPGMQGQPWCNCFVNWLFYIAFGAEFAKKILYSEKGWCYYTPTSASYFMQNKAYTTKNPKPGYIIYFKNKARICHVGIVYKVDSKYVYTIEGNTSTAKGVVRNGGGVAKKSYPLSYANIAGYGIPNWDAAKEAKTTVKKTTPVKKAVVKKTTTTTKSTTTKSKSYNQKEFIKDVMEILKVKTAKEAFEKSKTISRSTNKNHALVTPVERYLKSLGYYTGEIEADKKKQPIFGAGLETAVKNYQKSKKVKTVSGKIALKSITWEYLLGLKK